MNATIFLAILSHPRRAGQAIAPQEPLVMGAPLHLSLHTTDQGAVDALNDALREEWNLGFAYAMGPAEGWDRARLSRTMVERGYLAAVIERPVAFAGEAVPA